MAIKLTKPILLKAIGIKANNHVFPTRLNFFFFFKRKASCLPKHLSGFSWTDRCSISQQL